MWEDSFEAGAKGTLETCHEYHGEDYRSASSNWSNGKPFQMFGHILYNVYK